MVYAVLVVAGVVGVWLVFWFAWHGLTHWLWLRRNRRRYGWW